jgi:hypothetical protein
MSGKMEFENYITLFEAQGVLRTVQELDKAASAVYKRATMLENIIFARSAKCSVVLGQGEVESVGSNVEKAIKESAVRNLEGALLAYTMIKGRFIPGREFLLISQSSFDGYFYYMEFPILLSEGNRSVLTQYFRTSIEKKLILGKKTSMLRFLETAGLKISEDHVKFIHAKGFFSLKDAESRDKCRKDLQLIINEMSNLKGETLKPGMVNITFQFLEVTKA